MSLALIAALPFLGALLPAVTIRAGRNACALSAGLVTLTALVLILQQAPAILAGQIVQTQIRWLPQIGLHANFMLDGLGLLFALLILGIGLLIILYARFYLAPSDPMGRFFAFLLLFQGAMLGIVLSDNVLLLLVFWELTSLSSFLLIGYWKHLPAARQGARMALAVTGSGGLAMMGGLLILGSIAGSYDLSVILTQKAAIQASPLYLPALILILLGCFTKSAQFPFHFWLPHAMAAPTPVSAYLHSATMVKAGLFLMARLWPVLAGTPEWFALVATTGLVTMLLGAAIALFQNDLKALLAYSTVSQLGFVTFCLGLGTPAGAVVAVFHILNHATFKAALFMTAGIIDHAAHTRDIRRLGGLAPLMPITATIAIITALSMAGVPLLNGFLSKEMMLEEASHTVWSGNAWVLPALATLGAVLSVAYALRYIAHVFFGPRQNWPQPPHEANFGLWSAPALLAALVILIGVAPSLIAGPLIAISTAAVTAGTAEVDLKLWHGLTPALGMSLLALIGGALLLWRYRLAERLWNSIPRPDAKRLFEASVAASTRTAHALTDRLQNGALSRYLAVFLITIIVAAGAAWLGGTHLPGLRIATPISPLPAIGWLLLMAATLALVATHHNRLVSLVLVAVIGLIVSVGFAYFSAPDLALTQISVEVVTVILMLLALNFLPKTTPREGSRAHHLRDAAIALTTGTGVAALIYAVLTRDMSLPPISGYHLENAYTLGGGNNVVNVILVDFRGYDTYGEIIVLGIAAMIIFAMTEALLHGTANARLIAWRPDQNRAGDRHPLMMVVVTRALLPAVIVVGLFILLRGHSEPGGGFVAGLIVAVAALMQYMASGFAWSQARARVDHHALVGAGVLIAGLTGIGSWFLGRPFLTSSYGYFRVPPFEEFELATAMLFDAGVFLTVLGAVMLVLASLSRIARRAGGTVNRQPMDIDPSHGAR